MSITIKAKTIEQFKELEDAAKSIPEHVSRFAQTIEFDSVKNICVSMRSQTEKQEVVGPIYRLEFKDKSMVAWTTFNGRTWIWSIDGMYTNWLKIQST